MQHVFIEVYEEPESGDWNAWGFYMKGRPGRWENNYTNRRTVIGKHYTYHLRSNDFVLSYRFAKHIAVLFHEKAVGVNFHD